MRKYNIQRRSMKEMNAVRFERKPLSFSISRSKSKQQEQLTVAGAMLYWAEGTKVIKRCSVDFANSDPEMIRIFMLFLRTRYRLDENRLRVSLYCYSNQNIERLQEYWSNLTKIPLAQFSKPYIRSDFRIDGRKMKYGLAHIRYSDKKLLLDIMSLIERYSHQFSLRRWRSGQSQATVNRPT